MKKILIFGSGGHAYSCFDVIRSLKNYNFSGFVSQNKIVNRKKDLIIGCEINVKDLRLKNKFACIGIGQIKNYKPRKRIVNLVKKYKFILPKIISSKSYVSDTASIDEGTIVMHNVTINATVVIGKYCIINTGSIIEHNVKINDYCHISTGVILNGQVSIGEGTFIGSGTIIKENIKVGKNCIIGMGSVIKKDVPNYAIFK